MLFLKKIFFRSLLYLCLHDKMLKINKTKTWKAEISHLFIDIQVYRLYICIEQEKHNRLNIIIIVILNFQVTYQNNFQKVLLNKTFYDFDTIHTHTDRYRCSIQPVPGTPLYKVTPVGRTVPWPLTLSPVRTEFALRCP